MITRVSTGSLLFVLLIFPPNELLAARLDGNTDSATKRPIDTSAVNQTNNNASSILVSSFNETGIVLLHGETAGTGDENTDPNGKNGSSKRTEQKLSTKSSTKNSNTGNPNTRDASTRAVDTNTADFVSLPRQKQQNLETSYDELTTAAVQGLKTESEGRRMGHSSVKLDRPSASFGTDWTISSTVYTVSSRESVIQNEDMLSGRRAAGLVEEASTMAVPDGKVKETGPLYRALSFTAARAVDSALNPDFKTETELGHTFGTATGDHVTQTDDIRNWRSDVNVTQRDVTKAEFVYKSLWDDAGTENEDGKKAALEEGIKREGISEGATEKEGTGKIMHGSRGEEGRFTIPAELRTPRNRNEHFSLSFQGLRWREELNILIPVLCGMFGAMILVLSAYFLRNCPNNIRRMARMSRRSELRRRKSDLNLLIDSSSGDERP